MAQKTNKSFSRRLKVTRKGKVLNRVPGKNHFNARERRRKQISKKGERPIGDSLFTKQLRQKFLPYNEFETRTEATEGETKDEKTK